MSNVTTYTLAGWGTMPDPCDPTLEPEEALTALGFFKCGDFGDADELNVYASLWHVALPSPPCDFPFLVEFEVGGHITQIFLDGAPPLIELLSKIAAITLAVRHDPEED